MRHCRSVMGAIRKLQTMDDDELYVYAKELRAPIELVRQVSPFGASMIDQLVCWVCTPFRWLQNDGVFVAILVVWCSLCWYAVSGNVGVLLFQMDDMHDAQLRS